MQERRNHAGCGIRSNDCVGIDLEKELVESWVDADNVSDLMMHLEFKRGHGQVVVDAVEEAHDDHLGVTLSTVTRPALCQLLEIGRSSIDPLTWTPRLACQL